MNNTVLFTDLDNTLIYSHRHPVSNPILWVEQLNNCNQSYMTEYTYSFFSRHSSFPIVPITTRTIAQYNRLSALSTAMKWKHALVCNGAILLNRNLEDAEWTTESEKLSTQDMPSFQIALEQAKMIVPNDNLITPNEFMAYLVNVDNIESVFSQIKNNSDQSHVTVLCDNRKIYIFPKAISKGNALRRYMLKNGFDISIAAGDSEFDISMLEIADYSFLPITFLGHHSERINVIESEKCFSDALCDELGHIM